MKLKEFFDTDFKLFSLDDTARSLPNIVDGLKISQRKIIYGLLKRGESKGEIKVASAAGHISNVSDYHHGEVSLEGAIVGLAKDYAGSNNMNLLQPEGQFGSRMTKAAAASRYIFTQLTPHFRELFKKEDDCILDHIMSEGKVIEPHFYIPILPVLLINGSQGIGTGFACSILSYNPNDLKKYILASLKGTKKPALVPWYRGFSGDIKRDGTRTVISGKLERVNTTILKITELPIGTYVDKYKIHLNKLEDEGFLKSYDEVCDDKVIEYILTVPRTTSKMTDERLFKKLKLVSNVTENLTVWTENQEIKVFDAVGDLVDYFVNVRLQFYEKRRQKQIELLTEEAEWLDEKMRFIKFYLANSAKFAKSNRAQLDTLLVDFTQTERLLALKIYSLTKDEISKLKEKIKAVRAEIIALKKLTASEMYTTELTEFNYKG